MRIPGLALALALAFALPGCLEDRASLARVDEMRLELDEAQAHASNMTAEARAWRDAAAARENATAEALAQGEAFSARAAATDAERARLEAERAALEAAVAEARGELEAAKSEVAALEARVALDTSAESLRRALAEAEARLARVQARYDDALGDRFESMTTIERANVTWQWTDLRGSAQQWTWPMEEYRKDVKRVRPDDHVTFRTASGKGIRVADPRPYLDTKPFEPHVARLTEGRTAEEFVREAFRMKTQLVDYQFALLDERGFYKYPGESLVEATGICGDTTILLASVLAAGNAQADYGMEVALWIVDLDVWTGETVKDPETVDHAVLEVRFRDGTVWYVETTSQTFKMHPKVHGWRFAWA